MDAERFALVKKLLLAARERTGAERSRFLDEMCAGDPDLRGEVDSLLAHEDQEDSLFKTAGALERADPWPPSGVDIPTRIGPYEIIRELGRGGMGVVLRARQTEPIQREVAVKLMGVHFLSESMKLRFAAERQALASLEHPNIAHVIDAGTDETGRPYLVMELVKGEPITVYCDGRLLSLDERLDLFLEVCDAVRHAHQRGILHRDLKSSNVMVTTGDDERRVKVIDFGIAKMIGERDGGADDLTHVGQLIGTPDYMSPEQAGIIDAPVDTRTDVYALGILLYELLAGARPFHFASAQPREFLRLLDETGPPTPSALAGGRSTTVGGVEPSSIAEIAERRRVTIAELSRRLRGDLDAIALHALRPHPDDRYGSVDRLADDVIRHRKGLPVEAREGGFGYRASKFLRRHTAGVVVATLGLCGIVAFVAVVTAQRNRAIEAEQLARAEAETSRRVSDFLVDLFEVADPGEARGSSVTAREILDRGVDRIHDELRDDPGVRARLLDAMGRVYQSLGLFAEADTLLGEALALRRELAAGETLELAESLVNYGFVVSDLGDYARAESLYVAGAGIRARLLGERHPDHAAALAGLASVHIQTGNVDAAEPLFERVLEIEREALGAWHPYVALDYNDLASIRSRRGDHAGALEYYRRALEINRRANGLRHPETATNLANLGVAFSKLSALDSAIVYDRKALELREVLLGPDHAHTGISANNLAGSLHALGRHREALPLYERALAIKRATQGPDHRSTGHALLGLGRLLRDMGEHDRAETMLHEALDIHRASVGDAHSGTSVCLVALARLELARGRGAAAVAWAREAVRLRTEHGAGNLEELATAELLLADALALDGERAEAVSHAARAVALYRKHLGDDHERALSAAERLAALRKGARGAPALRDR